MAVSFKPISDVTANFAGNLCRWDGQRANHFEVWFLTLNHRASQLGFWFRYTLVSPSNSLENAEPRAALWGAIFDRRRPERNFVIRQEHAIDSFRFAGREDFKLNLSEGLLSPARATGAVTSDDHRISWNLNFTPNEKTFHHSPSALKLIARPRAYVCLPNLDTRFRGLIEVDGRQITLDDEPGCQAHIWGRKQVDEWVWVHSNAFEKQANTVFEAVAVRQKRFGRLLPTVQCLYLRHRGEEHRFTRLRLGDQWQRNLGIGYWSFEAANSHVRIEGTAQCRLRDMLQVEYRDPDGEPLYCINSEIAHLKIRLFRRTHGIRWRYLETIKAHTTSHLEHASRVCDPHVPLRFEI